MPKAVAFAVSPLLVNAIVPAALAQTPILSRFQVTGGASLYTGVEYLKLAKPSVPVVASVRRRRRQRNGSAADGAS